jgi:2-C-methyl-D-erythritol 4-phosphate cytidylyltransferase
MSYAAILKHIFIRERLVVEKNCAIIVAAGKGKRMGSATSKQFMEIKGHPILFYTLKAFAESELIHEIYLVLSSEDASYCRDKILHKYNFSKPIFIVLGGKERQDSVYNGLKAIKDCQIVLIHDGARPFVTNKIINNGIKYAKEYGASACGVSPKDTIKIKDGEGFSLSTPSRSSLFAVQTPQCFMYSLILSCHEKIKEMDLTVTDDTMIVEAYGNKVFLYNGSYENIKITTPEDMWLAEGILKSQSNLGQD